ncbi:MAG: hypothetical protein AAFU85_14590, partial [Planctomycetota bacterium]
AEQATVDQVATEEENGDQTDSRDGADLAAAMRSAKDQAERITADIVGMGGPVMRGNLMTYDTRVVALIAYLQRLGTTPPSTASPQ